MRVLSFIPAFLLAAASFVAAAPAPNHDDPSCVSNPGGDNGNDAPLQSVIRIIADATAEIQPLSVKLSDLQGDSCTADAVNSIVVQITAAVSECAGDLEAAAKVDLSGLSLTNLCIAIYAQLTLIASVLQVLVTAVLYLRVSAVGTLQASICNLLDAVIHLVGCLNVFVEASVSGVLGPVLIMVKANVNLLLTIVAKINVFFVAH